MPHGEALKVRNESRGIWREQENELGRWRARKAGGRSQEGEKRGKGEERKLPDGRSVRAGVKGEVDNAREDLES
jgi:hypothetical protein